MDILDAQIHMFYTLGLDETIAAMDALGIQSAVIDEFWDYTPDRKNGLPHALLPGGVMRPVSPLAQAAALRFPERFSWLQRVERKDPDLAAVFAMLASSPGCRSIRIDTREPAERESLLGGGHDMMMALAQKHGLVVSVLSRETGTVMHGALKRFPGVNFVLDHCGSPQSMAQWDEILALGTFGNCWLKWSHGHHFFEAGRFPYPGLQDQFARAMDSFGKERVMWASDFTHNRAGATWAELLFYLREIPSLSEGDREWLFARAARELFRWPAPEVPASAPHFAKVARAKF
ncbi:putative metal-dependent hydrolase of the TIM-barrel fold protein [Variovorax sp. PBL-H6]|uniref:amidohydrolase family protein n=1 Tax=Variovorax sp. PBL-H6 TaxID=434009 RepID=UPI0013176808|nr:amidohydrolase family protein [Variovorax sp. PBL-H6]VTU33433.1 putative metal-dependent hydrolase of the TIM-barrel fold protein [Variovorax sp. PBL-H6]